jgi:hypothetical protein
MLSGTVLGLALGFLAAHHHKKSPRQMGRGFLRLMSIRFVIGRRNQDLASAPLAQIEQE